MYNLIIIDDEDLIIDSLNEALKVASPDYNVVATFTNPVEALEYVKNNPVHIVITDIKMPQMSGVDLAHQIHNLYPEIRVIFLTAYSEITYAQQAIKYNVCAYLLKPINFNELKEALSSAVDSLNSSADKNSDNRNSDNDSDLEYDTQRAKGYVTKFMSKKISSIELYDKLKNCKLNITPTTPCVFIKLNIDNLQQYLDTVWKYGTLRLYGSLNNFYKSDFLYVLPIAFSFDVIDVFIVAKADYNNFEENVLKFIDVFVSTCADALNLTVHFNSYKWFDELSNMNLLERNQPYVDAELIFNMISSGKDYTLPLYIENELDNAILFGKFLIIVFSECCNNFTVDIPPLLNLLSNATSISEVKSAILAILDNIRLHFNNQKNNNEKITQKCIEYINKHYNENISLEKIAKEIKISSSQLSKIFKKTYNMKYVDYLNSFRIEKAKAFLASSSYNVNEISDLVGYGSYPYFLRIFKLYTGKTPLEYKKELGE